MVGIESLQGVETALTTRRKPVKGGLVVDERAHSPDIALGMRTRPFASLAVCTITHCSHWQAVVPLTTAVRPLVASLRLPSWMNDDPRLVPRLQLCWAPEFDSPVGLPRWTSCSSDNDVLQRPQTITYEATVTEPPMLDGWRLRGHRAGTAAPPLAMARSLTGLWVG